MGKEKKVRDENCSWFDTTMLRNISTEKHEHRISERKGKRLRDRESAFAFVGVACALCVYLRNIRSLPKCVRYTCRENFGFLWKALGLGFPFVRAIARPRTFMRLCWTESITRACMNFRLSLFMAVHHPFLPFIAHRQKTLPHFGPNWKFWTVKLSLKQNIKLYYIIFKVLSEPRRMLINDCVLVFVIAIKFICLVPFSYHLPAANSSLWLLLNDNRFPFLSSFPRYSQFYLLFKSFVCLASLLICFCWGFIISCCYCLHVRSVLNFIGFGLAHRTEFFSAFSHSRLRRFSSSLGVRRCRMKNGKRFFSADSRQPGSLTPQRTIIVDKSFSQVIHSNCEVVLSC